MIQIAVIGAGHWGPNLIRNFDNKPTSEIGWVVDRDPERLRQVANRFPQARLSTDFTDALADAAVDAVVVATPTVTHYPIVRAALESGKHVLVEKPIATETSHAEELCELAERYRRVLMVGHVFIYNSAVQRVKAYLEEEELGRVYYVSMLRTNLGPIRMDVDAAWDLASHDISIVNYWLNSEPLVASAVGGSWINSGINDAIFATLRYPRDILVNLQASWLHPRKSRDINIVGERRMLSFDDMNLGEPIRIYDKCVTDERTQPGFIDNFASFRASVLEGDITIPRVPSGEPLKQECDHFLECVAEGKKPNTSGLDGAAVVRVLEAISRSAQNQGREEKVVV